MQAAPDHHKVPLQNEHVRVLEAWVGPGDTLPEVGAFVWREPLAPHSLTPVGARQSRGVAIEVEH